MIQFNLLPDVKLQYIKTRRTQRLVATVAVMVTAFSLTVLVLMFTVVNILQKKHLSDVNKDIKTYNSQLQSNTDLPKILTVQNQLKSLPALHASKPVTSRLFDYLSKVVPANVSFSQLSIDFDQHTITFTGNANALSTVNQFADTLKFTTYTSQDDTIGKKAFSDVVLASFSKTDKDVSYSVTASFDPAIFDSASTVNLTVPGITTTRSTTDKPSDLFKAPASQSGQTGGQ